MNIASSKETAKQLNALKRRKINLSDKDAPEITNWDNAVVGKFYRPIKRQITIRIDADVLAWFQGNAVKYQVLINQVCREYMEHHKTARKIIRQKHL